ncbi:MAG: hypothetical protein EOP04_00950 [Proteobacteria bacterium]|nr:MAG: hypothetical protein EOP04_00950 [Pseudomonadota bacterium]
MDRAYQEQKVGGSQIDAKVAVHDLWSFCLDLADLVREEKISRWSMQQRVGERFFELGQDRLQQSISEALKLTLGETP